MTEREVLEDLVQRAEGLLEGGGPGAVANLRAGVTRAREELGLEVPRGQWDPPDVPDDPKTLPQFWRREVANLEGETRFEDYWMGWSSGLQDAADQLEKANGGTTA